MTYGYGTILRNAHSMSKGPGLPSLPAPSAKFERGHELCNLDHMSEQRARMGYRSSKVVLALFTFELTAYADSDFKCDHLRNITLPIALASSIHLLPRLPNDELLQPSKLTRQIRSEPGVWDYD